MKVPYDIVVVGAGQMGSRHLQGLLTLSERARLHVVDPSDEAIARARSRVSEIGGPSAGPSIRSHGDASTLPAKIDLAIIATNSDSRFAAMSRLLEHTQTQYLILEKVLFQKFSDYRKAGELLEKHGASAWVNCPRRLYPIYRDIKKWLAGDKVVALEVTGGEWGLGCNGIHFLDLFTFLSGEYPGRFDVTGLQPDCIPTRRPGFVEYTGTLEAADANRRIVLTAWRNSSLKHLITVRSERQTLFIDEVGETLWRCPEQGPGELVNFKVPYQSELSGSIASAILEHGACELPAYRESAALHLALLSALASVGIDSPQECCLVT